MTKLVHLQGKREALRYAVNCLTNGLALRVFVTWRSEASVMALKRAAFVRKQAAVREAVRIGDAIMQQRRWVDSEAEGWWPGRRATGNLFCKEARLDLACHGMVSGSRCPPCYVSCLLQAGACSGNICCVAGTHLHLVACAGALRTAPAGQHALILQALGGLPPGSGAA